MFIMTAASDPLADAYLWLVLNFHDLSGQNFSVDSFWKTGKDVLPRGPDGQPKPKRASNAENSIPDDKPQEGIQEEKNQVHDEHDSQRELSLVSA